MNLSPYPNLCKAEKIKSTPRILQKYFYSVYLTHQLYIFYQLLYLPGLHLGFESIVCFFSALSVLEPTSGARHFVSLSCLYNWSPGVKHIKGVQAKPEFAYQNCVKLIGHVWAHKHICALKYLFIQNASSITNVLPTSLTTCYEVKN